LQEFHLLGRSLEDRQEIGGDEIGGAAGADVKLRAERKLGSRAEALTPHCTGRLRSW
jgi:hypothetical protein